MTLPVGFAMILAFKWGFPSCRFLKGDHGLVRRMRQVSEDPGGLMKPPKAAMRALRPTLPQLSALFGRSWTLACLLRNLSAWPRRLRMGLPVSPSAPDPAGLLTVEDDRTYTPETGNHAAILEEHVCIA